MKISIDTTDDGIMVGSHLINYVVYFDPETGFAIYPLTKATEKEKRILAELSLDIMRDDEGTEIIDTLVKGASMWRLNWLDGEVTYDFKNNFDDDDEFVESFYEEMLPWFEHIAESKEQGA